MAEDAAVKGEISLAGLSAGAFRCHLDDATKGSCESKGTDT